MESWFFFTSLQNLQAAVFYRGRDKFGLIFWRTHLTHANGSMCSRNLLTTGQWLHLIYGYEKTNSKLIVRNQSGQICEKTGITMKVSLRNVCRALPRGFSYCVSLNKLLRSFTSASSWCGFCHLARSIQGSLLRPHLTLFLALSEKALIYFSLLKDQVVSGKCTIKGKMEDMGSYSLFFLRAWKAWLELRQ